MTLNLFNIPDNLIFIYYELSVISSEFDEADFQLVTYHQKILDNL